MPVCQYVCSCHIVQDSLWEGEFSTSQLPTITPEYREWSREPAPLRKGEWQESNPLWHDCCLPGSAWTWPWSESGNPQRHSNVERFIPAGSLIARPNTTCIGAFMSSWDLLFSDIFFFYFAFPFYFKGQPRLWASPWIFLYVKFLIHTLLKIQSPCFKILDFSCMIFNSMWNLDC